MDPIQSPKSTPKLASSAFPAQFPPSPPDSSSNTRAPSSDAGSVVSSHPDDLDKDTTRVSRAYPLPPASRNDNQVLPQDLKTPDNHVERDPRLIRLTGVHPFNVEAPLSDLFNDGFLTSNDLHYVRNHGAVPKVEDSEVMDWDFTVEGMVEHPIKLNLAELISEYEQVTYPVTLVCAGNRRKEQNVVRKTKGFSWGAAGVSTALWTGTVIGDVLKKAMPSRRARYVCFEGADKLPNGYYGTSVKLNWCMDPNRGIMLAHRMNGEALHPDHGKPLRIIIPGQIGGRSVKWLKRIIVTDQPSDNWYHIYDNRVLPTMVDPEQSANLPDTWKDERYAIYDLNTNSATCSPAHEERISPSSVQETYTVRGYAYAGGGKRVTRVEITLDKGKTWILANISYPEDEYRLADDEERLYGGRLDMSWRETCFCWCFWDLEVSIASLQDADDIMVRAMDESMMVQPRDMYWSVLGMMNNPWFRVVIHKEAHGLRFEHPTQPALMPGGWMERVKKAGGNLSNGNWGEKAAGEEEVVVVEEPVKEICMTKKDVSRSITIDELRKHDGEVEPWFVVNGEVYDGTKFLEGHPGGAASIFGAAGQDATEEFLAIHSENAKAMMPDYHIGTLDQASREALAKGDTVIDENAAPRDIFLQSKTWTRAILSAKKKVSPDTKIFTFDLEHASQTVGLPIGQHLLMRLRDPVTREAIIRAYTPISENSEVGKLHVLIKVYYDTPERKGGKMTQALDAIPVGHFVDFKGPTGKFEYLGRGVCTISGKQRNIKRFIMICGGSGITPIFQVLRAVMKDPEDSTQCLVMNGNRIEEDILCREEIDAMVLGNEHKCRLLYSLSKPGPDWTGLKGRMSKELFEAEAGSPTSSQGEQLVLVCGPEALEKSVHSTFTAMGWRDEDLLFF
ncbi:Nitrate reductase [NADPH] [Pestalotiopsis fici W106-1]|uniref:Nitrate reductase n=1 Tax=Pestalotiopsis fici (strain W106-1 / CGMCC3.15140) TaxID=1229662 RepID=W3XAM2_PESFW|nr:Nitrate reductase [NADPH] [Pestalotiopsis fici W106-1]ETS83143.1 Nitrate reductase [NADPH] [Pestalotiopsis fici W106-1]